MKIVEPDYSNNILSVITSITNRYGVKSNSKTHPLVDSYLKKEYKNVVLLIMDGMGNDMLINNCKDGILNQNKKQIITSVFPSTTVAALNSIYSGLSPIEHGWLGWSLYFKEIGRYVDVFPYTDTQTKEKIVCDEIDVRELIKFESIYQKINKATKGNIKTYQVWPEHITTDNKPTKILGVKDLDEFFDTIEGLCKNQESKFIDAYWDKPDGIMHKTGCYSYETKAFMDEFEKRFSKLADNLKGTDTLLIITADHGQIDVENVTYIDEIEDLYECLVMPPFIENRAVSFYVKNNKKKDFETIFKQMFKDDYLLFTKEEIIQKGLFGTGNIHKKADDFIGDYIACGISGNQIWRKTALSKINTINKGDHAGLTEKEMLVPLIIFEF